ncbi:hypothetical protein Tco_1542337 [Tanacetum coccineum]
MLEFKEMLLRKEKLCSPTTYRHHFEYLVGVTFSCIHKRNDIRRNIFQQTALHYRGATWKRIFKKRNKKKAKSKQIQARNGKDKVKGHPSEENIT